MGHRFSLSSQIMIVSITNIRLINQCLSITFVNIKTARRRTRVADGLASAPEGDIPMTEICYDHQNTNRPGIFDAIRQAIAHRLEIRKARANLFQMQKLDDRMLADIGISRDELTWAEYLPTTKNPTQELARCRNNRLGKQTVGKNICRRA
jgi:uncharacterized protein YjiS (DUF1127 family)